MTEDSPVLIHLPFLHICIDIFYYLASCNSGLLVILSGLTSVHLTFALSETTPVCLAKDKQDSSGGGVGPGPWALGFCVQPVASNCKWLLSVLQGGSSHTLTESFFLSRPFRLMQAGLK